MYNKSDPKVENRRNIATIALVFKTYQVLIGNFPRRILFVKSEKLCVASRLDYIYGSVSKMKCKTTLKLRDVG